MNSSDFRSELLEMAQSPAPYALDMPFGRSSLLEHTISEVNNICTDIDRLEDLTTRQKTLGELHSRITELQKASQFVQDIDWAPVSHSSLYRRFRGQDRTDLLDGKYGKVLLRTVALGKHDAVEPLISALRESADISPDKWKALRDMETIHQGVNQFVASSPESFPVGDALTANTDHGNSTSDTAIAVTASTSPLPSIPKPPSENDRHRDVSVRLIDAARKLQARTRSQSVFKESSALDCATRILLQPESVETVLSEARTLRVFDDKLSEDTLKNLQTVSNLYRTRAPALGIFFNADMDDLHLLRTFSNEASKVVNVSDVVRGKLSRGTVDGMISALTTLKDLLPHDEALVPVRAGA
ncbi:hypothetical protein P7C73_g205, partial [Tremellales sp. Uapishka_1]